MAEYKRKKVQKKKLHEPKHIKKTVNRSKVEQQNIKMHSTKRVKNTAKPISSSKPVKKTANKPKNPQIFKNFKVLQGFKKKRTLKTTIVGAVSIVVIITFLIIALCAPVNIFEATGNLLASIGSSSYPLSLSGGVTIDVKTSKNLIYILSDTHIDIINSSGKHIKSIQHGFENPAISISEGRSIVYDIGSTGYMIFNPSGTALNDKTEKEIICAEISRSGMFAIATKSATHTSEVNVINKDGANKYTWYCSGGTITNIALSSNGKKLAVGILSTENGAFKSKVNIMGYKSASAISTYEYDGIIYSLDTISSSRFCVTTSQTTDYCSFNGKSRKVFDYDYPVSSLKSEYSNYLAVDSRRVGDKSDNNIYILNTRGKQKYKVNYSGTMTDFYVKGNYIYFLGNSEIVKMNRKGNIVSKAPCSFSALKIVGSKNGALIITDNSVDFIKFEN